MGRPSAARSLFHFAFFYLQLQKKIQMDFTFTVCYFWHIFDIISSLSLKGLELISIESNVPSSGAMLENIPCRAKVTMRGGGGIKQNPVFQCNNLFDMLEITSL